MTTTMTGTYSVQDLWESRFAGLKSVDRNTIREVLEFDLNLHNMIVAGMFADLGFPTTGARDVTGSSTHVRGSRVDEFGRAEAKKARPGSEVGYPLHKYQYPTGWSSMWEANATPEDFLITQESVQKGNLLDIQMLVKEAIYISTNRTIRDIHVDNLDVFVKAFWNSDGSEIPDGNDGTIFDPNAHDHYLGTVAFDAAAVRSLIGHVSEHGASPRLMVYINSADMAAYTALGDDFQKNPFGYMVHNVTDVPATTRGVTEVVDFHFGWVDNAEIWVKPWAIAGYSFCFDMNQASSLGIRSHESGFLSGLTLQEPTTINPIRVDWYEQLIGMGVSNRSNGAILDHNNASYTDPTIN